MLLNGKKVIFSDLKRVLIKVDQSFNPESASAQSGKAVSEAITKSVGDIETALDELHTYAQNLINGGATE